MPASAQIVQGQVLDAQTDDPLVRAYVALVTEDQRSVVGSTTDTDGVFSLQAPSAGSYYLYAKAFGYQPVADGIFDIGSNGRLELEIRLEARPHNDGLDSDFGGFYERKEQGWGEEGGT